MNKPDDNEPRRSLWEVMRHGQSSDPAGADAGGETSESTKGQVDSDFPGEDRAASGDETGETADSPPESDSESSDRPKGLWALMQAEAPAEPSAASTPRISEGVEVEESDPVSTEHVSGVEPEAVEEREAIGQAETGPEAESEPGPAPQSDGSSLSDEEEADSLPDDEAGEQPGDEDEPGSLLAEDEEDGWEVEDDDAEPATAHLPTPQSPAETSASSRGTSRAAGSLIAGMAAVLLSGLTLLPGFAVRIPATLAGACALMLGYLVMSSHHRGREKRRVPVPAVAGMVLGLVGIFAGPLLLVDLGESLRHRTTREVVEQRLGAVRGALEQHSIEHGHYPAGGVFEPGEDGLEVARESWMTSLLPYLGYLELHGMMNHHVAWDAEVNTDALRQTVPDFLVPNAEHPPTPRGFATTHFAGVGGRIKTPQGLVPAGIFDRNSAVPPEAITDGESQTIIVGEIARALPSWGDPENWRSVETGLNTRLSSFGNADATGAYFLFADGRVKFFSNATSPRVLERLATRNTGD